MSISEDVWKVKKSSSNANLSVAGLNSSNSTIMFSTKLFQTHVNMNWKLYYYKFYTLIFLGSLSTGMILTSPCFAQSNILPDNTLGNKASEITPNVNNLDDIPSTLIEGGAERGKNLFHSFAEFNVSEGRGAYFLIPNLEIENVLTRVTGNNSSAINGILGMISNGNFDPAKANLFLINPNGIIFGKNSRLDIGGSFVGTTANAVEFGEQGFFSANNPQAPSELLTISPTALLFNQINTQASIENNSVTEVGLNPIEDLTPKGLRVADGNSLLFVGGDININGGGLTALGGRVELGGLAGTGTVELNTEGNNLSLSFPSRVERSDVSLSNGAGVIVIANNGGSLAVNARNLSMIENSFLLAGIDEGSDSEQSRAGNIDVNATGPIKLNNESVIGNLVLVGARGQGGDVNIAGSRLQVEGGAKVDAITFGKGNGGNLSIDVQDVQVIGGNKDGQFLLSALRSSARPNSTGNAGELNIKTNTLIIRDGGLVGASTFGKGNGGNLTVEAEDIQLIGKAKEGRFLSSLLTFAQPNSTGNAGNLKVETNRLIIRDGAVITTATFGKGNGGNLTVEAEDIQLIGTGTDTEFPSGLRTSGERQSTGNAGNLIVKTNTLLLRDGAQVVTSTSNQGKGGNLTVRAEDVQLIGTSTNGRFPSALLASTRPNSTGNAGEIKVQTNTLLLTDGAVVDVSTRGKGRGGDLKIEADTLQIINRSTITARSQATGVAGRIDINLKSDFNADNGQVFAQAQQSKGGDINITAKNIFLRNNSDIITTLSRTADSGGDIKLNANAIVALEDSDILAFAPDGSGGNITFNTRAFLSDPLYRPRPQTTDMAILNELDGNNGVDVNASGSISTGTISVGDDPSFLQDSLTELAQNPIDSEALIASTCVVRSKKQTGAFLITGSGGLRSFPGDAVSSIYSAVEVQAVDNNISSTKPRHRWKIGDPIVEPTGVYRLENGRRILSRKCGKW